MSQPKGSNDLNLLLKAKVVQIKVELDYKGSNLPKQVKEISKWLKDNGHNVKLQVELDHASSKLHTQVLNINKLLKDKPVKLNVELQAKESELTRQVNSFTALLKNKPIQAKIELVATASELNTQIRKLSSTLNLQPIAVKVKLDVSGSVGIVKQQLKDVNDIIQNFNTQLAKMQRQVQKIRVKIANNPLNPPVNPNPQSNPNPTQPPKPNPVPTNAPVNNVGFANYVMQLQEAEKELRRIHGKKGLFGSHEIKDADGNLKGFIASLTKANGVVQKIQYNWDENAQAFTPIKQETVTNTQKHVKQAIASLRELDREIFKIDKKHQNGFWNDYNKLAQKGHNGTLTNDEVSNLKRMIKDEQVIEQILKKENDELLEQKKLIHEIRKARDKDWDKNQDIQRRSSYNGLMKNVNSNPDNLKEHAFELKKINDLANNANKIDKEHLANTKKRLQMQSKLRKLENSTLSHDKNSQIILADAKFLAQRAKSAEDWFEVQKNIDAVETRNSRRIVNEKSRELAYKSEQKLENLRKRGIITQDEFNKRIAEMKLVAQQGYADLEKYYHFLDLKEKKEVHKQKENLDQKRIVLDSNTNQPEATKFKSLVDGKDITQLEKYFGTMYKGEVETIKIKETTDKFGRSVEQLDIRMKGHGKTIKTYTVQMEKANGTLREVAQGTDYNANRNLGVFEQLKIAMARVPVWMASMTAFYGTIHSVQAMTGEILQVDKAMTELKRVTSSNINVDTLFEGAVGLSKELGNNIHDIMDAMSDLSRTYGEFNERQLLAVTRTAILMSNVSDLTVQEATSTLVGTMNAFNIEASESIKIVDSLNEVDNNYAISTKQLAEGLQKSASTAKTFGVTMEENIGHITAIGAVTMESGAIIGNSLKTIYSRMTTVNDARSALEGVGLSLYEIGETGKKQIKPVNKILSDLAGKWGELSAEQKQNLAVTVAGRYQLSRFLAMMNNWQMSTKATRTALSAQGSAMRENAKLMDSFGARINKLKNAFTEMSIAVGDKTLNSGIFLVIEGLTSLANMATKVINTVGALPIVVGIIGLIMAQMGVFKGTIGSTVAMLKLMGEAFTSTSIKATGFSGAMVRTGASLKTLQVLIPSLTAGLRTLGVALKGLLASTVIGIIFVGIGVAIEKIMNHIEKQKRIAEKAERANKQLVDSYRNTTGGLNKLIDKQAELQNKVDHDVIKEGTDAYNEYVEVTNTLAQKMPTIIKYIDQSGLAHLREAEAIKEQYDIAKKLSELKAQETKNNFSLTMDKNMKKYREETRSLKELEKAYNEIKKQQKEDVSYMTVYNPETGKNEVKVKDDGGKWEKLLQKNVVAQNQSEIAKAEYIQKTLTLIQDTTLAYLEQDKVLKDLSDTGLSAIESMVQSNEELVRSVKDSKGNLVETDDTSIIEANADKLRQLSTDLGTYMSKMYEGLDDKGKESLDGLVKALPDTFFKLDTLDNIDTFKEKFQGILNISKDLQEEAEKGSFDGLTKSLMKYNMTEDEAKAYAVNLGLQYNNTKIKAEALEQAQSEGADSLEEWVDTAIKAIDVTEQLFNINDTDIGAMKSHIENLQSLIAMFGDSAKEKDSFKDSLEALSLFTGIPEDVISKDLDYYRNVLDLMGKVQLKYDENTGKAVGFDKEGLNKNQIAMMEQQLYLANEYGVELDFIKDKMYKIGTETEMVWDKNGKLVEKAKEVKKTVEDTNKALQDTKWSDYQKKMEESLKAKDEKGQLEGLQEVSKEVEKTGTTVKEEFEDMKVYIKSTTGEIVDQHKLQWEAMDKIGESARKAKSDVLGLNGSLISSMGTLSTYSSNAKKSGFGDYFFNNPLTSSLTGGMAQNSESGMSASTGDDSGSTGGGDSGTSGTLVTPKTTLIGMRTLDGGYVAQALAVGSSYNPRDYSGTKPNTSGKKPKKSSKGSNDNVESKLEELYVMNQLQIQSDALSTSISILESKMSDMAQNTNDYRNALKSVITETNKKIAINKKELTQLEDRNAKIERAKKAMGDTKTHTEKERQEYNKIVQEQEQNLGRINSLKTEIQSTIVEIRNKSLEIFNDFIGQIVNKWDATINAVKRKVDNVDFNIQVAELKNPDDKNSILNLQKEKESWLLEEKTRALKKANELQAEYDKAVKKYGKTSNEAVAVREELWKAQEDLEDATIAVLQSQKDIEEKALEIFNDSVDNFVSRFDKAIDDIKSKVDNIDFKIEVLGFTNPDDKQALLNAQGDKAMELRNEQSQRQGKVNGLETKYSDAVKKYGVNSKQAQKSLDELNKAKEELEDITIAVLQAEKAISDTRTSIIDDSINALKDYYGNMKQMATDAIDSEIKHLEEAHKKKMESYDDEIKKINDVYDAKFKAIDEENSLKEYEDGLSEKNAKKAELTNKIALLSRDNTLEGRKKLAELQKELTDLNKEIKDFQDKRADEELKKNLETQKEAQVTAIETKKETEQTNLDEKIKTLETEKEEVTKHYDDLINDDKRWADMRNEALKGNFTLIQTELGNMDTTLTNMNKGIFDGLTKGFSSFSDEVKKQIEEVNKLLVNNMIFNYSGVESSVDGASSANPYTPSNGVPSASSSSRGRLTTGTFSNKKEADALKSVLESSYQSSSTNVEKDGDKWRIVADFESVERAEKVLARLKEKKFLSVGYISSFDTGGYTGDWAGNDGKLAMLHKKEIVLNPRQTKDILDTAKIIDRIKGLLPSFNFGNMAGKLATAGNVNVSNTYGDINVTVENGDKKKAQDIAKEILTGMKKRGK